MNSILKGLVGAFGGDAVIQVLISLLASKGVDAATRAATVKESDAKKIAAQFGVKDAEKVAVVVQDFRDLGALVGKIVGDLTVK